MWIIVWVMCIIFLSFCFKFNQSSTYYLRNRQSPILNVTPAIGAFFFPRKEPVSDVCVVTLDTPTIGWMYASMPYIAHVTICIYFF